MIDNNLLYYILNYLDAATHILVSGVARVARRTLQVARAHRIASSP